MAWTFPSIPPSFSPDNKETIRNTTVQFADGYDLVVGDGINAIRATKSLSWDVLEYSQMAEIVAFFRAHINGGWFYYHLDEDPNRKRKFMCDTWTYGRVANTQTLWWVKAELKEVFRPNT